MGQRGREMAHRGLASWRAVPPRVKLTSIAVLVVAGLLTNARQSPPATPTAAAPLADLAQTPTDAPPDAATAPPQRTLLTVTHYADGDSFTASDGVEYRVGLVNTPEVGDCGASDSTNATKRVLAAGFTAEAWATDRYGRTVARIVAADGTDLGIHLARTGMADDRHLDDFRHENPAYARDLDAAFAAAKAEGAGHWSGCWAATESPPVAAPPPSARSGAGHTGRTDGGWSCHPAYEECLPDGPDLDCKEVGHSVHLTGDDDPYRLDGDNTTRTDGVGCETWDAWSPAATYPYY